MGYDANCCGCPYFNQQHLSQVERTCRDDPPVEAEVNDSDVLIVALAPGTKEWKLGSPLIPCKRQGGTAGSRMEQSWKRKGKKRKDFDIIEAVQCYPGKGSNGRDKEPAGDAVNACAARLRGALQRKKYRKVIALGKAALKSLQKANTDLKLCIVEGPHPTGGGKDKNTRLDALW